MEAIGLLIIGWLALTGLASLFKSNKKSSANQKPNVRSEEKPLKNLPVEHSKNSEHSKFKTRPNKIGSFYAANLPIDDIEFTADFKNAFDLMESTNNNIFITGKAGTGKSTLLRYFRAKTKKKVVVVAPTGIAAVSIEGQTIHSFFWFPLHFVRKDDVKIVYRR
jgi:ATPase subunit of ABC transporter with duplicated ATPase domains